MAKCIHIFTLYLIIIEVLNASQTTSHSILSHSNLPQKVGYFLAYYNLYYFFYFKNEVTTQLKKRFRRQYFKPTLSGNLDLNKDTFEPQETQPHRVRVGLENFFKRIQNSLVYNAIKAFTIGL